MIDLDEELKRLPVNGPTTSADDVLTSVRAIRTKRRTRRRIGTGVALVMVIAVMAGVVARVGGDRDAVVVDTGPDPATESASEWHPLEPGPLAGRPALATVWTGDEFVVIAGSGSEASDLSHVAAYHPPSATWREASPGPTAVELYQSDAVWSGEEVVVIGRLASNSDLLGGAAWNPSTNEWRVLPTHEGGRDAQLDDGTVKVVWAGTEAVVTGAFAAWNPSTGTWRDLPPPPIERGTVALAWSGSELLAVGSKSNGHNSVSARFDPDALRWIPFGDPELNGSGVDLVWDDQQAVVVNHSGPQSPFDRTSSRYLPSEHRWQLMGTVPWLSHPCAADLVTIDGQVVAHLCTAVAVLNAPFWVPLPPPPSHNTGELVAAGAVGLEWGFDGSAENGTAFDLFAPPRRENGHVVTRQFLVSTEIVDLPDGAEPGGPAPLGAVETNGELDGRVGEVTILRVDLESGHECAIRSAGIPTDAFGPAGSVGSYLNHRPPRR